MINQTKIKITNDIHDKIDISNCELCQVKLSKFEISKVNKCGGAFLVFNIKHMDG